MNEKQKHIILLFVVGIFLATLFYSGANLTFDDASYLKYSSQVLAGNFSLIESPYAYGISFIYSIAGAQALLGTIGPSILQMLEYVAIGITIYYILLKYFDSKISFVTALCVELSAYILGYASRVLPDMLLGLSICVIFLILAYKKDSKVWMLIAGLISGLTISIKIGGFVLLLLLAMQSFTILVFIGIVVLLVYSLFKDPKRFSYIIGLFLGIGIFAIIALPFSLLNLANSYISNQIMLSTSNLSVNFLTLGINTFIYNPSIQTFPIGAVFLFSIIGTILVIRNRDEKFYFATLAFWSSLLYLYFGTESFTSYVSIVVVSRYFIELSAPMAILAGVFLSRAVKAYSKYYSENKILILITVFTILTNLPMYVLFFIKRLPVF